MGSTTLGEHRRDAVRSVPAPLEIGSRCPRKRESSSRRKRDASMSMHRDRTAGEFQNDASWSMRRDQNQPTQRERSHLQDSLPLSSTVLQTIALRPICDQGPTTFVHPGPWSPISDILHGPATSPTPPIGAVMGGCLGPFLGRRRPVSAPVEYRSTRGHT